MNQNSRGTRASLPSDLPPSGDEEDLHSSSASGLAWSSNADGPLDYGPSVAPSVEPRAPYKPPGDEDDLDDEDERSIAVRRNGSARVRSEAGSRPVFRSAGADDDRPFRGRDTSSNIDPDEKAAYGLGDERAARQTRSNREPALGPSTPFKAGSGVSALAEHPFVQQLLRNAGSLPFVGGSVRSMMSKLGVAAVTAKPSVAARHMNEDVQQEDGRESPQIGESDEGSSDSETAQKPWWKNKKVIGGAVGVVVFVLWLGSGSSEPSGTPVKADGEHVKTMLAPDASKIPSDSEPLRAGMSLDGDLPPPTPVAEPLTAPASAPAPVAAAARGVDAAMPAVTPPWGGQMTLSPASSAAANAAAQAMIGTAPSAIPAVVPAPPPAPAPVAAVKAEDPPPPGAEDAKPATAASTPVAPPAASAAKPASEATVPAHQAVAKPAVKKAASAPAIPKTAKQAKPASGETQADREKVKALNQQLDQLLAK